MEGGNEPENATSPSRVDASDAEAVDDDDVTGTSSFPASLRDAPHLHLHLPLRFAARSRLDAPAVVSNRGVGVGLDDEDDVTRSTDPNPPTRRPRLHAKNPRRVTTGRQGWLLMESGRLPSSNARTTGLWSTATEAMRRRRRWRAAGGGSGTGRHGHDPTSPPSAPGSLAVHTARAEPRARRCDVETILQVLVFNKYFFDERPRERESHGHRCRQPRAESTQQQAHLLISLACRAPGVEGGET